MDTLRGKPCPGTATDRQQPEQEPARGHQPEASGGRWKRLGGWIAATIGVCGGISEIITAVLLIFH